jgi:hemerythrin-like domain-containing protein
MKKGGPISERMHREHGIMIVALNDFMKGKKDSLDKLIDLQSRHAFAEEKAIMVFYRRKKDFKVLSEILEQHEMIKKLLEKLQKGEDVVKKLDVLMKKHITLEDKKFYPLLDKDLMPEEQDEMFKEFVVFYNQKRKF